MGVEFESGADLSGGQWQRVAMARALYGESKKILILDEPTSQIDPMAESEIFKEFASLAEGRTTVMISHRLGSTAITDRIIVLSGGKVEQEGSHEELLKSKGLYADMFELQKSWYERSGSEWRLTEPLP
jgi:ATP-binding cassette subfamily B protein